jgi:DNA-binding NtrC family response regulator
VEDAAEHKEFIYIVDDESALGQMANTILSFRGYKARVFSDPVKALEHMQNAGNKPSLLITDCIMGTMNGLELIEHFKTALPSLKTILMSGTITDEFVQKCPVRPDRFIPKPYSADTLLNVVDELMEANSGESAGI